MWLSFDLCRSCLSVSSLWLRVLHYTTSFNERIIVDINRRASDLGMGFEKSVHTFTIQFLLVPIGAEQHLSFLDGCTDQTALRSSDVVLVCKPENKKEHNNAATQKYGIGVAGGGAAFVHFGQQLGLGLRVGQPNPRFVFFHEPGVLLSVVAAAAVATTVMCRWCSCRCSFGL